ncbi:hypothetical protein [Dubosiella newyorkensis]|uniref:hypothetical protein n=1 Tax=Dubosiella newyorkensis TaxID=1862672 RepID=UPI0023F3E541|nr:hypothetical protein [Dubosiella newyorkensis]
MLNQLYWLHPSQWLDKKVGEEPVLIFPNGKIYTEAQLEQLERADRGFSFLEEDFDDSEDFYFEEEFF